MSTASLLKASFAFTAYSNILSCFPDGDGLCPAFHTQLVINIADMTLHGGNGDDQLPGDILVGTTGFDEFQDFHLARGQRLGQAAAWRVESYRRFCRSRTAARPHNRCRPDGPGPGKAIGSSLRLHPGRIRTYPSGLGRFRAFPGEPGLPRSPSSPEERAPGGSGFR